MRYLFHLGARYAAFSFVFAIGSADGAVWEQTPLPDFNVMARAMAVAPSQPARVYLASDGLGVWRSNDRGDTWESRARDVSFDVLEVSPHDADVLFAASDSEISRSSDGGVTWASLLALDASEVGVLLFHPADPAVVLAAAWAGNQPGLYRTTNGGTTWSLLSSVTEFGVESLAMHPSDPLRLLAAGRYGVGSARSTDGGATWTPFAERFYGFAWSSADPTRVFAALNDEFGDSSVHRSDDGGVTFSQVGTLPPFSARIEMMEAHPSDPTAAMAGGGDGGCGLLPSTSPAVWRTTDAGVSWTGILGPVQCFSGTVVAVHYDPVDPTHAYLARASVGGGGFRHSTDGGGTWAVKVNGIYNYDVHHVRGDFVSTIYAMRVNRLYRSVGDLSGWTDQGEIVSPGSVSFLNPDLQVSSTNPLHLFLGGQVRNVDWDIPAIYESADGGLSWSGGFAPTNIPISTHVYDAATDFGLGDYAATGSGLYLKNPFFSTTYELVNASLTNVVLAVRSGSSPMFIANGPATVEVSTNWGGSTTPRNTGLPAVGAGLVIKELFIDPAGGSGLVALYSDGRVYTTLDQGLLWTLSASLDLGGLSIADASWDPATKDVFVVRTDGALVTSHPDFTTSGLPAAARSVHYSAGQSVLFVGTRRAGMVHQFAGSAVDVASLTGTDQGRGLSFKVMPVPTSGPVSLEFRVPASGAEVELTVFDVRGRLVRSLVNRYLSEGSHRAQWDGTGGGALGPSPGVYFARLQVGDATETRKLVLRR